MPAAATGAAAGVPRLAEKVLGRLRLGDLAVPEPEVLAPGETGRLPDAGTRRRMVEYLANL